MRKRLTKRPRTIVKRTPATRPEETALEALVSVPQWLARITWALEEIAARMPAKKRAKGE